MDDLKIILYVVVAIIWVVYNNYRKITDASKKRDLSKPQPDISAPIPPPEKVRPVQPPVRKLREVIEKQPRKLFKEIIQKKPLPVPTRRREKIRTETPAFISS